MEVLPQWRAWVSLHVLGEICVCFPKSVFRDIILVAWNGPWRERLHHGNWQSLQIRTRCQTFSSLPLSWTLAFWMNEWVWNKKFTFSWVDLPFASQSLLPISNATAILFASGWSCLFPLVSSSTFYLQHPLDSHTLYFVQVSCCCCWFTTVPTRMGRVGRVGAV